MDLGRFDRNPIHKGQLLQLHPELRGKAHVVYKERVNYSEITSTHTLMAWRFGWAHVDEHEDTWVEML